MYFRWNQPQLNERIAIFIIISLDTPICFCIFLVRVLGFDGQIKHLFLTFARFFGFQVGLFDSDIVHLCNWVPPRNSGPFN
jgi:hypothetical protein